MKRTHSTVTVLAILVAFAFLYVIGKTQSVSDQVSSQQGELEQKLEELESRIESLRQ